VIRAALLVAGALCLAGCERPEPPPEDQAVRPAKLFRARAAEAAVTREFVGQVAAAETIDVSFEVGGEIVQLPVLEGQTVPKGQLVAALDPRDFELAAEEARVQLRLAQQDLQRKEALLRERSISQALVDDARAVRDLAQVKVDLTAERLADTRITAPFDALVARRYVDNRSRVQPGVLVARLLDLEHVEVVTNVPEELLTTVSANPFSAVTAHFDLLPDRAFPLAYREARGESNAVAQTFEVKFTMARPAGINILPGMTVRVRMVLPLAGSSAGVSVPTSALQSDPAGAFFVWVYDPPSSTIARRPVEPGALSGSMVVIRQGLADGEQVVAAGASQLQDGMQIRALDGSRAGS